MFTIAREGEDGMHPDFDIINEMFTDKWELCLLPQVIINPQSVRSKPVGSNPMEWQWGLPGDYLKYRKGLMHVHRELVSLLQGLSPELAGNVKKYETCFLAKKTDELLDVPRTVNNIWTAIRPDVSVRISDIWRFIMFQRDGEEGRLSTTHANLFPWFRRPDELITLAVKRCHVDQEWDIMPMRLDIPDTWPAGTKIFNPE